MFANVDRYGNTSAGSIPICLDEAWREGRIRKGDVVLMVGFGGGLAWGSCVMEWTKERAVNRIAFCFPGQGSQRAGMGRELAEAFPESAEVFEQANRALGFDLRALCFEGTLEQLSATEITQPALVAASLAALRAVESQTPLRADVVVGHSVGEYAALAAAGTAADGQLLRLVHRRGQVSAGAGSGGAMAAVLKLADERVEQLCAAHGDVWPANYNCPGQVVISGSETAVEAVSEAVREEGGKVIRLKVAGAFHSPLMADAAREFAPAVSAVVVPRSADAVHEHRYQ